MNATTKNTNRFVATFALVTALTAGAQAADVAQIQVKYDDLNVNSKAGAAVLYQRIRTAAGDVCDVAGTKQVEKLGQAKACVDRAIAKAVAQVNAPSLRVAAN